MENFKSITELANALKTDIRVKSWIAPNQPLFTNSGENSDMFLTTYRIRNSYELLLNKLDLYEDISEEKDMILVSRLFEMDFYPPRKMSLSDWKNGRDPVVKISKAYKDLRWKGNRRRRHEITLELDNGKKYQINPNNVLNKFLSIRESLPMLSGSSL